MFRRRCPHCRCLGLHSRSSRNDSEMGRGSFCVLGTDGYGRSDTRAALRKFFEVDSDSIVVGALSLLEKDGIMDSGTVASAIEDDGDNPERFDVTV